MFRAAARSLRLAKQVVTHGSNAMKPKKPYVPRMLFSTESAAVEKVKVPAPVFGIAGKYASALYVSATRAAVLPQVEEEVATLAEAASLSETFDQFLRDPSVSQQRRLKIIQEIFADSEFTLCPITKNFLYVLAEGGILYQLPVIASVFDNIMAADRGEVAAEVTSAMELTDEEMDELTEALSSFLEPGQTLVLDQTVDRSIIGGLVVDIGDKHIDLSIESKIREIEKLLEAPLGDSPMEEEAADDFNTEAELAPPPAE
eukprot:TRINITY_DN1283_c0_g1_i1.p1 TRINITY_DN1283_c0_g1~~TRINITY_DN1283_c0_g1_i1.p1  ORF type:complete len:259 (+),score=100.75 TRINITY_DN1283_c0_g1_i1:79-855(+)